MKKVIIYIIIFFLIVIINSFFDLFIFYNLKSIIYIPFNYLTKEELFIDNNYMYESIKEENNELLNILDLTTKNINYIPSLIIEKDYTYLNKITISKGINNNIKKGDAVISNNTLIGIVSEVYNNYSTVELLTKDNYINKISIKINETYGLLTGFDELTNTFIATNINAIASINVGDIVTTGYSTNYDQGIYIGNVEQITIDNFNLNQTIKIKTDINYTNLKYVIVVTK